MKERSSAHEAQLVELANLEEQQRTSRELVQRQRAERDVLGKLEKHRELRVELAAARRERTGALMAECQTLSTASDGTIRATLKTNRGFDALQARFRGLISGSNVRANKVDAFFEELAKESSPPQLGKPCSRSLSH